ncbi:MAG: hypothetical protein HY519_00305 [Candidatus Aenigmarchaeota archaeon]|nr:hypothetical protein [Candidatus Aenigmarchaeota archaeon]
MEQHSSDGHGALRKSTGKGVFLKTKQFRVGVTSGIYYAARSEELANAIRKLGYTLTRGADCMEIAADVAHEVPYSHGREIRHMARKQEVQVLFHGDLQVPLEIPERADWRDAHDRMTKSIRSAIYAGAAYIDFHASLNFWLEMQTYGGRKLTTAFVDHDGRFIKHILKENAKLREWFIEKKWHHYVHQILKEKEQSQARIDGEFYRRKKEEEIRDATRDFSQKQEELNQLRAAIAQGRASAAELREAKKRAAQLEAAVAKLKQQADQREQDAIKETTEHHDQIYKAAIRKKLERGEEWDTEELRAELGLVDGYIFMAYHLFFTKDPMWVAMAEQYKDVLIGPYAINYKDDRWLDKAWRHAEETNDRRFKEFFYAAVGSKYLEGHLKAAFHWLEEKFIKEEIPKVAKDREEEAELKHIAENLIIGMENPDSRSPEYAGLFILWRTKQIYAAVKSIRDRYPQWGKRVMMIVDHEHLANQGLDALNESNESIAKIKDFGELVVSVHANHPNPLQPHIEIEMGDVLLYTLLHNLRKTGFGKKRVGYLIFERGGGEDPFKHSVDNLRLMAYYLEQDVKPDDLPPEFFGVEGLQAGSYMRQLQIVRDHTWDVMKDLLEIPEEEWTFLSSTAVKKGKKPEQFKRAEFR